MEILKHILNRETNIMNLHLPIAQLQQLNVHFYTSLIPLPQSELFKSKSQPLYHSK